MDLVSTKAQIGFSMPLVLPSCFCFISDQCPCAVGSHKHTIAKVSSIFPQRYRPRISRRSPIRAKRCTSTALLLCCSCCCTASALLRSAGESRLASMFGQGGKVSLCESSPVNIHAQSARSAALRQRSLINVKMRVLVYRGNWAGGGRAS